MQNILVPLGSSDHAESNLAFAIDFAAHFNSTIYVIDAYPVHSSKASLTNINATSREEMLESAGLSVAKILDRLKPLLGK